MQVQNLSNFNRDRTRMRVYNSRFANQHDTRIPSTCNKENEAPYDYTSQGAFISTPYYTDSAFHSLGQSQYVGHTPSDYNDYNGQQYIATPPFSGIADQPWEISEANKTKTMLCNTSTQTDEICAKKTQSTMSHTSVQTEMESAVRTSELGTQTPVKKLDCRNKSTQFKNERKNMQSQTEIKVDQKTSQTMPPPQQFDKGVNTDHTIPSTSNDEVTDEDNIEKSAESETLAPEDIEHLDLIQKINRLVDILRGNTIMTESDEGIQDEIT